MPGHNILCLLLLILRMTPDAAEQPAESSTAKEPTTFVRDHIIFIPIGKLRLPAIAGRY